MLQTESVEFRVQDLDKISSYTTRVLWVAIKRNSRVKEREREKGKDRGRKEKEGVPLAHVSVKSRGNYSFRRYWIQGPK